ILEGRLLRVCRRRRSSQDSTGYFGVQERRGPAVQSAIVREIDVRVGPRRRIVRRVCRGRRPLVEAAIDPGRRWVDAEVAEGPGTRILMQSDDAPIHAEGMGPRKPNSTCVARPRGKVPDAEQRGRTVTRDLDRGEGE